MSKPTGLGMVGIGGYAPQHLTAIRTLQQYGQCRLLAIADPFADRQGPVMSALKTENVDFYDDLSTLLERDDIDAVILATPIHLHAPQVIQVLNAGKHVYTEKPPCVTLQEYSQMLYAQEKSGKQCVVGFQAQTGPGMQYLKRRLVEGFIGELETVWASIRWKRADSYYERNKWVGRWRADGFPVFDGPATNALSHVVHASMFLAGETPEDWGELQRVRGTLKKARPIESYDSCFLEGETASGVSVKLALTHASPNNDEAMLRCRGTQGEAQLTWGGVVRWQPTDGEPHEWVFHHNVRIAGTLDFLALVEGKINRPATRLQDTLPYLQLVNGALQSHGGSTSFAPELIERGDAAFYSVRGLDEQFETFAADSDSPPPLLTEDAMTWVAVDDIRQEPNF